MATMPPFLPYNPMGGGVALGGGVSCGPNFTGCNPAPVGMGQGVVGVFHGPIQGQEYKYNNQGHGL